MRQVITLIHGDDGQSRISQFAISLTRSIRKVLAVLGDCIVAITACTYVLFDTVAKLPLLRMEIELPLENEI